MLDHLGKFTYLCHINLINHFKTNQDENTNFKPVQWHKESNLKP